MKKLIAVIAVIFIVFVAMHLMRSEPQTEVTYKFADNANIHQFPLRLIKEGPHKGTFCVTMLMPDGTKKTR